MDFKSHIRKAQTCMEKLSRIGARPVGSRANRLAADYFLDILSVNGFKISKQEFDCIDWQPGKAYARAGREYVNLLPSPYSPAVNASSKLICISSLEKLYKSEAREKILLLCGDICREQLMPKNYPFYNPLSHKEIIRVLEEKGPAAIIAVTSKNPEMAGALYPFPLFEDGDFNIPSAYVSDKEGEALFRLAGKDIELAIESKRIPSKAANIVGRKNGGRKRIVLSAHIDTKEGTPGALDNGTGITVLAILANMLKDSNLPLSIEIAALNGEDYYLPGGHLMYLEGIKKDKACILAAINIDGAGYRKGGSTYSLFNFSKDESAEIENVFLNKHGFREVRNWYQGDHMIFAQNKVRAVAITSEESEHIMAQIAHTPKDNMDNVDVAKLVWIASALKDIVYLYADKKAGEMP